MMIRGVIKGLLLLVLLGASLAALDVTQVKTKDDELCVFPFKYKGFTYHGCTDYAHDEFWCALDSVYVKGRWGNCVVNTDSKYRWSDFTALQWRHNGRDGVSNHQPRDCLLSRLFRHRSKKTSKIHVTGLFEGNSAVTGEFPALRASNAENVSIWWRHHDDRLSRQSIRRWF